MLPTPARAALEAAERTTPVWTRVAVGAAAGGLLGLLAAAIVHEGAHLMLYNRYGCTTTLVAPMRPGLWVGVQPDCPAATEAVAGRANLAAEAVGYHLFLAAGVLGAVVGGYLGGGRRAA